jgi:hypothetical protein
MLKALIIRLISLAAVISSFLLIIWTGKQLRSVFQLTDPSGLFGAIFNSAGFLANIFVIFLFGVLIWRSIKNRSFSQTPRNFTVIFCLKVFEALNFLPCLVNHSSDMCSSVAVMLSYITSPLIIVLTLNFILRTEDRQARRAGLFIAAVLALAGAVAWLIITPKKSDECLLFPKITAQAICQQRFAMSSLDIGICDKIEYRPVRYECMKNIARQRRSPGLCEEIQTPPGANVFFYEVTAADFRDVCYYQLAVDLRDKELCRKMQEAAQMQECLDRLQAKPAGGK